MPRRSAGHRGTPALRLSLISHLSRAGVSFHCFGSCTSPSFGALSGHRLRPLEQHITSPRGASMMPRLHTRALSPGANNGWAAYDTAVAAKLRVLSAYNIPCTCREVCKWYLEDISAAYLTSVEAACKSARHQREASGQVPRPISTWPPSVWMGVTMSIWVPGDGGARWHNDYLLIRKHESLARRAG